MQKIITILFFLMIVLSITACDAQETGIASDKTSNTQITAMPNVSATDDIQGVELPDGTESAIPDETETAVRAPLFDTSWASNEFEALIPELPFDGWTVTEETDTVYAIMVIGLNTGAATNPPDSGEPDGADKDIFLAYLNTLPAYGFSVEETGAGYMWLVTDPQGNEIVFKIGDGGCFATFTQKSVSLSGDTSSSDNRWVETIFEQQIPQLPAGEWTQTPLGENGYSISAKGIEYAKIDAYVGELYTAGYTIIDIVPYDGVFGEVQAEKQVGMQSCTINLQYNAEDKSCVIVVRG